MKKILVLAAMLTAFCCSCFAAWQEIGTENGARYYFNDESVRYALTTDEKTKRETVTTDVIFVEERVVPTAEQIRTIIDEIKDEKIKAVAEMRTLNYMLPAKKHVIVSAIYYLDKNGNAIYGEAPNAEFEFKDDSIPGRLASMLQSFTRQHHAELLRISQPGAQK